jgi:hypothetical protein
LFQEQLSGGPIKRKLPVGLQRYIIEGFSDPCDDATQFGDKCPTNAGYYTNRNPKRGEPQSINCFPYCVSRDAPVGRCSKLLSKVLTAYPPQVRLYKPGRERTFRVLQPPSMVLSKIVMLVKERAELEEEAEQLEAEYRKERQEASSEDTKQSESEEKRNRERTTTSSKKKNQEQAISSPTAQSSLSIQWRPISFVRYSVGMAS